MADTEAKIWSRVIRPSWDELTAEAAHAILQLKLGAGDVDRINKLSALAREGTLSKEERAELEDYLHVGRILTLMHSQARRALKSGKGPPPPRRKAS